MNIMKVSPALCAYQSVLKTISQWQYFLPIGHSDPGPLQLSLRTYTGIPIDRRFPL